MFAQHLFKGAIGIKRSINILWRSLGGSTSDKKLEKCQGFLMWTNFAYQSPDILESIFNSKKHSESNVLAVT